MDGHADAGAEVKLLLRKVGDQFAVETRLREA